GGGWRQANWVGGFFFRGGRRVPGFGDRLIRRGLVWLVGWRVGRPGYTGRKPGPRLFSEGKQNGHEPDGDEEDEQGERGADAHEIEEPEAGGFQDEHIHRRGDRGHERGGGRERDGHGQRHRRNVEPGGGAERDGGHEDGGGSIRNEQT